MSSVLTIIRGAAFIKVQIELEFSILVAAVASN